MKPPSAAQVTGKLQTVRTLAGAGVIRPQRPDRLFNAAVALIRWGATPAAGYKAAASRYPDDLGLIDESGTLTFKELHERSNALAHALASEGVKAGDAPRAAHSAADTARFMAEQYRPGPPGPDPRAVTWMSLAAEPLAPYDARWRTSMTFSPSSRLALLTSALVVGF